MAVSTPPFYVIARVVGSEGSFQKWTERLVGLCGVSGTELHGSSYYWGQDLDGEPDTLWGLEGYSHAVGFFLGHQSTDTFREEMSKVDEDKLLKEDYDLHHYDLVGGFLSRPDDDARDSKTSFVAVLHFWAKDRAAREAVIGCLGAVSASAKQLTLKNGVQSCSVLRECNDLTLATLWIRTRTENDFVHFKASEIYSTIIGSHLAPGGDFVVKTSIHRSQAFNGHIDKISKYGAI